jgi:hypothetical protein
MSSIGVLTTKYGEKCQPYVAAALGAKHVAITDSTPLAAQRNLDSSGLTNAHVSELYWRRAAWRRMGAGGRGAASNGAADAGADALAAAAAAAAAGAADGHADSESEESGVDEDEDDVPTAEEAVAPLLASLPGRVGYVCLTCQACI